MKNNIYTWLSETNRKDKYPKKTPY